MECGESLVPHVRYRNAVSVSPEVNTKAYHDAFERMPIARTAAQGVYRQAGRILIASNNTEFEYLVAVNARTGALVVDNLHRTASRAMTGFNAEEMACVQACRDGVVLVHNHPASKPPSYRDVHTAATYSCVRASVVVGHDGSVWWISVDDAVVAVRLESHYNDYKDDLGDFAEVKALNEVLDDRKLDRLLKVRRLR